MLASFRLESRIKFVKAPLFDLNQSTAAQGVLSLRKRVKTRAEV